MAKYFTLQQCMYSATLDTNSSQYCGDEESKQIGGNVPGDDYIGDNPEMEKDKIITNINNLMFKCTNPIKDNFPDIVITSVYRSKTLNEFIGGSSESQHMYGYACDIVSINTFETYEIFNWVIDQGMEFDQMIWEFPEKGKGLRGSWLHISYKSGNNRKKTTLATKSSALHDRYGGIVTSSGYQHNIKRAYPEYLTEKSENAAPPVSKHPDADQVEPNRGYYFTKTGFEGRVIVKDDDMNIIYTGESSSGSVDELIQEAKIALKTY
jgi:hypothetical protein